MFFVSYAALYLMLMTYSYTFYFCLSNNSSWLPLPSSKYDVWRLPLTVKNVWVKVRAMTENNINLSLFINDSHQYYFSDSDSDSLS
jgi:hypothetical protein